MRDEHALLSLYARLWKHVSRRRRTQLAALGALMLVGTFAELVSLGMVLPFLGVLTAPERAFEHVAAQPLIHLFGLTAPQQLLLPLTALFALAAALAGAVRLAMLWLQMRLGSIIGVDLGYEAYRRTLYQPYAVHAARNSSEIIAALMTKIHTIVYFILVPTLTLLTSSCIVLTILVFMVLVDPQLTAMTFLAFGGLYVVVAYTTKRSLARDSQLVTAGQTRLAQLVQEGLGGIRDVLIDGLQETYSRIYRRADAELRRAIGNINFMQGAPRPVIEAFGLVLIGWLAYAMAGRPGGMTAAIPVLGALALAAQRLLPLVQQGYSSWTSILGGEASLRDVLSLLEQPLPVYSALPAPAPLTFREGIEFNNVQIRYGAQSPLILRGIQLRIRRGSRTGLIGATGSGKSTLLDVLMGLLPPTAGTLRVDGTVIDDANHRSWQAHIAHVPQVIYLADATVSENIAFGVPVAEIDHARVRRAAQLAQIAETIESWQDGYQTVVGERGSRLSGGQRQRIGIARALYKQTDVIVFDEATSALDDETELAVMQAIDSLPGDLTIFTVAHRLSTLRNCDQIIELSGGAVQRVGTYKGMIEQAV
ncbi:MAG TPA: ABC transporter ATP-binding protein [Steroidobacteraceae bacterium]|nr:ABC transporter ATP-binding protein [Steroidobacteraceae bacterium]